MHKLSDLSMNYVEDICSVLKFSKHDSETAVHVAEEEPMTPLLDRYVLHACMGLCRLMSFSR